ncbi:TIR domain-containing protein [Paenibacillus oenotherae]|uniref:TIR domain-containing protein n=1 Tax=Paenibacillus oenotherae TaxID=1435645 RepID=A0ABS7D782_9BACL|nr:TIR domain-containing protein [Paenibacillus oenotherae]MBW7475689.1 TIR domain-containing protein [Paenibacillus oenotherae]
MKVFLSWSGDVSKKLATVFHDWLPSVIQSVEPYISSEDIDKGARWSQDVGKQLEETSYGIIFITPENISAPWINFEAGALSKAMDNSLVSPFLFQVKNSDLSGPLTQFQTTLFEKEEIKKLLFSVNKACRDGALSESRLVTVFEKWWPDLEQRLTEILPLLTKSKERKQTSDKPIDSHAVKTEKMLEEILELTRLQQRILRSPDELFPKDFLEYLLHNANFRPHVSSRALMHLERAYSELEATIEKYDFSESIPNQDILPFIKELGDPIRYLVKRNAPFNSTSSKKLIETMN